MKRKQVYYNQNTENFEQQKAYNSFELIKPSNSYLVYTAILSQSGTNAPVATILGDNTIGDIVWSRNDAGSYTGILAGAFPDGKTFFPNPLIYNYTIDLYVAFIHQDMNGIYIQTYNGGALDDGVLDGITTFGCPIEIRVYL